MGRKRKHNRDMPERVYWSNGQWFFAQKNGPWIPLGADKTAARKQHADLLADRPSAGTMAEGFARYRRDVLPKKAPKTQKEYGRALDKLGKVFGHVAPQSLTDAHVGTYLDSHPKPVSANREVAVLSAVFTKMRRWGLYRGPNPCQKVERNAEKPRELYVTDEMFLKVYEPAPLLVQVMMGLALLTGQREGDLVRIRRADLGKDGITFTQGKTGKKLLVRWTDALAFVVEQAAGLPRAGVVSTFLVSQPSGQPYTANGFRNAWKRYMRGLVAAGTIAAAERFRFHDLRAKAGSDAKDGRLLGHADPRMLRRVYMRKPEAVDPVR